MLPPPTVRSRPYRVNHSALAREYLHSDYQLTVFSTGKGGAAICLRYGTPNGHHIVVYDGGTVTTGNDIVDHIVTRYDTKTVDHLVCSHPCANLAAGLWPILERLEVRQLWMHRPWLHSRALRQIFSSRRCQDSEFAKHIEDKIAVTFALEETALERDVNIAEPFQGEQIGPFIVMSPHRDWYIHRLLQDFENPPLRKRHFSPELVRIMRMAGVWKEDEALNQPDSWENETLTESGETTAEMESSVVLHGLVGGQGILLTGNAGIKSLSNAAAFAEHVHIPVPSRLRFLQVPCQGNPDHLSPSVLDRLVGAGHATPPSDKDLTAYVATPYGSREIPHLAVVNALQRRGANVFHAAGRLSSSYLYSAKSGLIRTHTLPQRQVSHD